MNKSFAPLVSLLLLSLVLCGCGKPTPENERKKFNATLEKVAEVKAEWRGFATFIDAETKAAETQLGEAEKAADVEKMRTINSSSMPLAKRMEEVWYKKDGCEKQIEKLRKLKLQPMQHEKRKDLIHEAEIELAELDAELAKAAPSDQATAMALADAAVKELISLGGNLRSGYSRFNKSTKKSKKKSKMKLKSKKK